MDLASSIQSVNTIEETVIRIFAKELFISSSEMKSWIKIICPITLVEFLS